MATKLQNRPSFIGPLILEDSITSPLDSSHLTPPISGLSTHSPPPRAELDDYFSSKKAKRRHEKGLRRPSPTSRVRSEETGSGEALLVPGAEPGSSKARNVESSFGSSDDAGFPTGTAGFIATPGSASIIAADQPETVRHVTHSSPEPITPNPIDVLSDQEDSPAVNYLRRISESQSSNPKRMELNELSKVFTDKLPAMFRTKGRVKFRDVNDEEAESNNTFGFHQGFSDLDTLEVDSLSELSPTSKSINELTVGLRVPASITLRKASGIGSSGAENSFRKPTSSDKSITSGRKASVFSLLGFQSQRNISAVDFPLQEASHLTESPTSSGSGSTFDKHPRLWARLKSVTQLESPLQGQQYVLPPDTALTLTSFYPIQPALSKQRSRSSTMPVEKAPCRYSVVQVVSRKSIHEVIWYENESSTSASSTSPADMSQKSRGSGSPRVLNNDKQKAPFVSITTVPTESRNSPQSHDHDSENRLLGSTNPHQRLASWSWDSSQPLRADGRGSSSQSEDSLPLSIRKQEMIAAGYDPNHNESDSFIEALAKAQLTRQLTWAPKKIAEREEDNDPTRFDRGLDMFKRRGLSLGSVGIDRTRLSSVGEKARVNRSSSASR